MSLASGTRLGPYEIVAPLGAGGMGEVYRARDTNLGRDVALKTLPERVTHDPERLARFRREAQMLAALNHPHIGSIYGLEESGGHRVLVLELVEGETLADRGRLDVSELLGQGAHCRALVEDGPPDDSGRGRQRCAVSAERSPSVHGGGNAHGCAPRPSAPVGRGCRRPCCRGRPPLIARRGRRGAVRRLA